MLNSLQRKKLTLSHCHCPWNAMAQVMARQRSLTEGEAREPMILLIVEPSRVAHARELAAAVSRYAPFVVCWIFEADASPRLRQYVPGVEAVRRGGGELASEPKTFVRPRSEPRLVPVAPDDPPARLADGETPSLTAAELQMLLTGEPPLDVARPGQGRGRS